MARPRRTQEPVPALRRPALLLCPHALALAWGVLALQPFPRGPGGYFSVGKLLLALLLFLAWVRLCWWADRDADQLELPGELWSCLFLGAGVAGVVALWVLPFWMGCLLFAALQAGTALAYVGVRNERVGPARKLLTRDHLRGLGRRWLGLSGGGGARKARGKRIPLQLVGRSMGETEVDESRVSRAQESPEYQGALELIQEALERQATDIHVTPAGDEMQVRFRIDGMLQPSSSLPRATGEAILNILKVLANLDITEKRKPQDGSFSGIYSGSSPRGGPAPSRMVDFRVATAGSVAGEKMVLRILDRAGLVTSLEQVGMRKKIQERVRGIIGQPHGMFIVCGPTGAGKSTTLYSCLMQIDRYQRNVITLENPVEYRIDNATQIEINTRAGKTFANELRSILRQDPDVIYIGEIRDAETAEIACQAAQTGHMVFTTLHANDCVTALGRLFELGVPPYLVASAVTGILGQRLIRLLCPACKKKYRPSPDLLRRLNLPADRITWFYEACATAAAPDAEGVEEGDDGREVCDRCGGSGYRGRTGIFELLLVTDSIREMIREGFHPSAVRQEAIKNGTRLLQEEAMRLVIEGETSIKELLRTCA